MSALRGSRLPVEQAQTLAAELRGELKLDEPMGRHCSWRCGGPAAALFLPADLADIQTLLSLLPASVPVEFIGLGSNLLVRDGGFDGVLVATQSALGTFEETSPGAFLAEAGVPCAKLAKAAARGGWLNAAFLAGIPGTIGGALAQNAGAFGGETWQFVQEAETVNRMGKARWLPADAFAVGYRQVNIPESAFFTRVRFDFGPETDPLAGERIRDLLARRAASQPTGQPSCGSVFRNPEGDHAGRLIEAAGLKGFALGGARISERHANFIINENNATADDIERLMALTQDTVRESFGVELVPEVRVIGAWPGTAMTGEGNA